MQRLFNFSFLFVQSVIKKKKTHMDRALKHFDEFYGNVYGKSWEDIRAALLMKEHKYMAVVNNFSDIDRIKSEFEVYSLGKGLLKMS